MFLGANSGIGFAIAKELAAAPEPFHIILAGRTLDKVNSAIADIKAAGHHETELTPLHLDVTNNDSIEKAAFTVKDKFGRLDVLINNAGIAPEGPDLESMFNSTFTTNVTGPVLVSSAFRSLLLASSAPYSIYIGSSVSSLTMITDPGSSYHVTTAGSNAYRASKAALNMIAMHEQIEVADTSMKVRILCPGFVVSNLRGTSEEARTAGGYAGDPGSSARLVLSVLRGERDGDASGLITANGVASW